MGSTEASEARTPPHTPTFLLLHTQLSVLLPQTLAHLTRVTVPAALTVGPAVVVRCEGDPWCTRIALSRFSVLLTVFDQERSCEQSTRVKAPGKPLPRPLQGAVSGPLQRSSLIPSGPRPGPVSPQGAGPSQGSLLPGSHVWQHHPA